jgi:hypothetical protein
MRATLDEQTLFDKQQLEIEVDSFSRDSIEKAVPGLDGIISIDMGRRSRRIKQAGTLRGKSRTQLNDKINAISIYMDGGTHILTTRDGEEFANLRMDSFTVQNERTDGTGIVVDYEINYMQLA